MAETLLGLEGVSVYMDDILVYGDTIEQHDQRLTKLEDTGTYRIGVGNQSSYNVNLDVRKDPCYGEPRTMTTYRGQNISIICNYPLEFKEFSKYVYKEDSDYLVKDIRAIIEKSQKSRFLISYERSAKVLSVNISDVREVDGGVYLCGVMNRDQPVLYYSFFSEIQLHIKDICHAGPKTEHAFPGQNISIISNYPVLYDRDYKYIMKLDNDSILNGILDTHAQSQNKRFSISDNRNANVLCLSISNVTEADDGVYLCGVYDRMNSVEYYSFFTEIQLHVRVPPLIIIIIIISVCVCVTLIGGFTLLMVYKLRQKKTQGSRPSPQDNEHAMYAASLNVFVNIRHHYETHNGEIYNSLQGQLMAKEDAFRNGDRVLYNQARNTLNKEIRVAKRSYAKKLENQFSANDPVSVWKGLKDITNYKTPSPSTEANQQLAEDLNEFYCRFETAGLTPHAPSEHLSTQPLTPPATPLSPPPALQISEDYVRQIFLKQKKRKAPGPDGVTPACLRTCADQLAFIFSQIFNRSLELCEVPACFKRSNIIPIPKKPKITGLNDYRPVALTSVVMKLFERLVLAYLKNITGPLLDPLQFAY
ncbi:hypothetical protein QTP70_007158 [Hemibagrus guttatus]|uniref:Immunoglobulin domain-containing protein n=1 Tax=Hemibagrus guttatus TaxID=175788 RepID=A0AAE0QDQ5_9TELE|nr:hypothetical protein QTP70_007158 [Hemibagrus guttatus]